MRWSLGAACLWVLIATVTALLPMRRQFPLGLVLLILAPAILIGIGVQHGAWFALAATLGFLSMFRKPLMYLGRKALGLPPRSGAKEKAPQ